MRTAQVVINAVEHEISPVAQKGAVARMERATDPAVLSDDWGRACWWALKGEPAKPSHVGESFFVLNSTGACQDCLQAGLLKL